MVSPKRNPDLPGTWYHVCARGIARRAIFELHEDTRFFLELLDDACRDERIELHSFCLMTNHLHLLLVSLDGQLSCTMRDILSQFIRWFNLRRNRDGPLMKRRFFSRPIYDDADRYTVVRYIDQNPVKAGLVDQIFEYPFGSAWHYGRSSYPRWLARHSLEQLVRTLSGAHSYCANDYEALFGRPGPPGADWLVEEQLRTQRAPAGVDQLLLASSAAWAQWMQRAQQADGTAAGLVLAPPDGILASVAKHRGEVGEWLVRPDGRARSGWEILVAGLLRVGCRRTVTEIADLTGATRRSIHSHLGNHRRLFASDPIYRDRATRILRDEVRSMLPVDFSPALRSNFPLGHSRR